MNLLEVIQQLLGRHTPPSATTARQRLQLVLAHDRSDLNPELLEQMRREILEVVQRYVEIDLDGFDVTLESEERVTALVANVPIKRTLPQIEGPRDIGSGSGDGEGPAPVPAWLRAREHNASDQASAPNAQEDTGSDQQLVLVTGTADAVLSEAAAEEQRER